MGNYTFAEKNRFSSMRWELTINGAISTLASVILILMWFLYLIYEYYHTHTEGERSHSHGVNDDCDWLVLYTRIYESKYV